MPKSFRIFALGGLLLVGVPLESWALPDATGGRGGDGGPVAGSCDPDDGEGAIRAKYRHLRVAGGFQLANPSRIWTARDGVGKFQTFSDGYYIFWSPTTCARLIHGAIYQKWEATRRELGASGYPISDETDMYDGRGVYSKFQNGFIVSTNITGAHPLYGAIGQKWWELVERGLLGSFFPGYPTTDEDGPANVLRWAHFELGSIYWQPHTGAHETHGAIRDLWLNQLGPPGPSSWLGGPRTDEKMMPDGRTPYQRFENGVVTYDWSQRNFVTVPNPSADPYFAAARLDLLYKQKLEIGKPIPNLMRPLTPGGSNLLGFQPFLESDNIVSNSMERHSDGGIYLAYTPRTSPYWYDPYLANDTDEHPQDDAISFGYFEVPQLGLPQPLNACRSYKTPVPNLTSTTTTPSSHPIRTCTFPTIFTRQAPGMRPAEA